jgi:hypothetical protein
MPTQVTSGATATDGTEQTLATDTTNKTYIFVIDTNAMLNGDQIEIRCKTKTRSGDTSRVAYYVTYANVQGEPQKYSEPIPANIELIVTLKRVAGTDRTYNWALLSL